MFERVVPGSKKTKDRNRRKYKAQKLHSFPENRNSKEAIKFVLQLSHRTPTLLCARYNGMVSSDSGDGIIVGSGRRATDIHQDTKDVYAQMLNTGKVIDCACWTHSSLNHLHEIKSLLKIKTERDEKQAFWASAQVLSQGLRDNKTLVCMELCNAPSMDTHVGIA